MHKFCPECGKKNAGWRFCPDCGFDLNDEMTTSTPKSSVQQSPSSVYMRDLAYLTQKAAQEKREEDERKEAKIKEDFEIENGVLIKYKGHDSTVEIPNTVKVVAEYAFHDSVGVEKLIFPSSVLFIDRGGCCPNDLSLKEVRLSEGLLFIGTGAFSDNYVKSIVIPKSVMVIERNAFFRMPYVSFQVCDGNKRYRSVNGNLISTEDGVLMSGTCDGSIPADESITSIAEYAFSWRFGITNLTIPDTVTEICAGAFCGCDGIKSVKICSYVDIDGGAFMGCGGITSIIVPEYFDEEDIEELHIPDYKNCKIIRF